jgi:DNA-binding transcriptional regulator YiaG
MPDIASTLKAEIARLARKEIRTELSSLKKASAQHRAHIAALRREVEALEQALKRTKKGSAAPKVEAGDNPQPIRFRAGGIASHRKRLGLSAAEFARLLGVSAQSIYKWETGEVRPRQSQIEAFALVRKMGRREVLAKLASE